MGSPTTAAAASSDDEAGLPYWQVNVPPALRTAACPDFLRDVSAKDAGILGTPDAAYRALGWDEVRRIVADNRLGAFQRAPSALRRYLANNWRLRAEHGSVMNFVLARRLRWAAPVVPRGRRPFECAEADEEGDGDVKILWNDWPYGLDERIVHLVVWTKFDLDEDPDTGDLTDEARRAIDEYVNKKFGAKVPREDYIWFKNWASLKSVRAVEHFHVMMFNPDPEFIKDITNGDVPLSAKV